MNVLIAEDDELIVRALQTYLSRMGMDVQLAENGEKAIEVIKKEKPDVLLLDLLMPNKDGFAVLDYIQEKQYDFPIMILTNLGVENDRRKCETYDVNIRGFYIKGSTDLRQICFNVEEVLA